MNSTSQRDALPSCQVLVVIVCYRSAELTLDCLQSLAVEYPVVGGLHVAICENGSGDESARVLREAITHNHWSSWVTLRPVNYNGGFTGGNNIILREALGLPKPPAYFLLINPDTIVRPGAIATLLAAAEKHPDAGIIGPRLEWPDGTPQISCFLDRSPSYEFFNAARTRLIDRLFGARGGTIDVSDVALRPEWVSFGCALIRREVFAHVGLLDEGYFMYFDDPDFCRRARVAGWSVLYWPSARVVHLRGKSSPVKERMAARKRPPRYWYESRARYYCKFHGRLGVIAANLYWTLGRCISLARELLSLKQPHTCEAEWRDIWTNWRDPMRMPTSPLHD